MRCDCCGRSINPANAVRWTLTTEWADGQKSTRAMVYGPVCAVKRGKLVKTQRTRPRISNFAVFGRTSPVRVEDGQIDIFGVAA